MKHKKISIVGLGYIGLPTAALLADRGYYVSGFDVSDATVEAINSGLPLIKEADLEYYVKKNVKTGKLTAKNSIEPGDIYMICVPTPLKFLDGSPQPNIEMVMDAASKIFPILKDGDLVILESTCPVGTTQKIYDLAKNVGVNTDAIHFAYCPERVLPGHIMKEIVENDRIVGGLTQLATEVVANFYKSFVTGLILETDSKTAELSKLAENSFRDVNIAFANELSMICEEDEIDIWEVIKLANHHPRVNILDPGAGVGGHCIAVDPWFIVHQNQIKSRLIRTAREVNTSKTDWVIEKVKKAAEDFHTETGSVPKITCLGLSYKPNTSDMRESPALKIVLAINALKYETEVIEPNISFHAEVNIQPVETLRSDNDIIVVLVKHKEFMDAAFLNKLKNCVLIDTCGLLEN